ncbi:MAG: hypothetical protein HC775_17570 [Hyellaceae cyanobacterium CSU_1_1]|nr:hypothetical protein [Pleurocapsa sp. CRU_1_2]NJR47398.1 hypothetical protein [Hyellaceae cyanobacterium CSU_1_1]
MELYYEVIRNSLGKVDQVIRRPDGASLLFDPISKQFDEEDVLTLELREWSAQEGELDLSDRPIEPLTLEQAKAQKNKKLLRSLLPNKRN